MKPGTEQMVGQLPIASKMVLHLLFVLLNPSENIVILDPYRCQQIGQVLYGEMPIWTAVRLARSRRMFCQDLLAAERAIPVSSPIGITAHIPVCVTYVISVHLVEVVVRDRIESLSPEGEAFFQIESDTFQEESVLQPSIVLQFGIAAERAVQVLHAERKGWRERVDVACGDVGPR
jgi:hypothetical protein